ncbi:MAG: hypothetical protein A2Z20_06740 [Bdellovibrionales bacterium RBG_16_40_8]|nr:MAG: hypothetical protein A2Z20_06740 [Bdellovibrionales bacterium RBG_16_40_8]
MVWSIGLHAGESVTEIVARQTGSQESPLSKSRVLSAQNSTAEVLQQFITQHNITQISRVRILTQLSHSIIASAHGTSPAVLTTLGFENWLELCLPLKNNHFTTRPERISSYIDRELVFGANERTNAQGHIEKILDEAELEFLVTKLSMHGIKNVAICFLHSQLNNENERRAKQFLENQGFKVFVSSNYANDDEKSRFWTAILNAYVEPLCNEKLSSLATTLQNYLTPEADVKLGPHLFSEILSGRISHLEAGFSLHNFLIERFAKSAQLFYCGLEKFLLFKPTSQKKDTWSNSAFSLVVSHYDFIETKIQPLTKLGKSFFCDLAFLNDKIAFDPGPMVLGRGMNLTVFDLLSLNSDFASILGVAEKISERGQTRVRETLSAYSRHISEGSRITAEELLQNLLQMAVNSWRSELGHDLTGESIVLCGPLATSVQKLIGGKTIGDDFFAVSSLLVEDMDETS